MMAVLQRVRHARVEVDAATVGRIEGGLLVLLCAECGDTPAQADALLHKILKLRIFADEAGRMNRSVQDVGGQLLVVSQFTLAADTSSGNRPSFTRAAPQQQGRALYGYFLAQARARMPEGAVQAGVFGADMQVSLCNDGPVTISLHMPTSANPA